MQIQGIMKTKCNTIFKNKNLHESMFQVVDITLENMSEFMPRMGYLFTDGMFDLSKVLYLFGYHSTNDTFLGSNR